METMEQVSFQIISAVGTARSMYVEAIREAKEADFAKAEELLAEGEILFSKGHQAHATLVQKEAGGEQFNVTLLLVHAEDLLMSAEEFQIIARELIDIYKRIK